MKKQTLFSLICFSLALICLLLCASFWQRDNLYNSVIRIHVLADSDEKEDQERKLLVRDSILHYAKENLPESDNREEAKKVIAKNIRAIETLAEETLTKEGCDDKVKVMLEEEYYPTRHYESFSLPAGTYLSLKVLIGKAEGQNWWCVLFPPICLSSATDTESAFWEAGMSKDNIETVMCKEKEYKIRFKILEMTEEARRKLKELF